MNSAAAGLGTLTHRERTALRELLIRATAAAGHGSDEGELEQLVRVAPIDGLPAAAAMHRVAGTVRRALDRVAGVPDGVLRQLDAVRQRSSLRHLLLTGALSQIGNAFDASGLSWAVMKGPVVAALLYPDVGDRSYADLDLLVDRRDFPPAIRVLEGLGYQHKIHDWALAEDVFAGQVGMTNHSAHVDVHWHLHFSRQDRRPFALDPNEMIARRRHVAISGIMAPTLDPVDTLITLAFHAARSGGHRLVWLKDVERSMAVERPDLDELVRRCREYRCGPPVEVILGRAHALLDTPVPDAVHRALSPASLRAAERLVCAIRKPVQLHERPTITRVFTRSVRSSAGATLAAVPARAARGLRRLLFPTRWNDIDSADDKERYLRAVAGSVDR
jgi:Uncharacterised nucleotidyltransferase